MNKEQLLDKLEEAIEIREAFWLVRDTNMVRAWEERCQYILNQLYGLQNETS